MSLKACSSVAISCLSAASVLTGAESVDSANRPNIVFLLADDVNRDTWGVYGSKDCKTPNIDRLANDGARFDKAYCSVAMCAPFRQQLYSGRSPWRTGTLANHSKSKAGTKSIAHYLEPLEYRTVLLGKTHIGPRACYPFEYISHPKDAKTADNNPFYMRNAKAIMEKSIKTKKPFCLFVASNDGHGPYTTGNPTAYKPENLTIPPYWVDTPELRNTLPKYYAEVTNFDALVGEMRTALEEKGLWENTILMVCSEQGTGLPFAKWTCYDNGLHSGLVVHWPGVTKPGSIIDALVSISDVTPTLVEAAGGQVAPKAYDGESFLSLLKGQKKKLHDYVFGAFTNCNILGNRDRIYPIRVIRDGRFSLIYNPNHKGRTSNVTLDRALEMVLDPDKSFGGVACSWVEKSRRVPAVKPLVYKLHHRPEYELYDLDEDPYELHNLIDDPAHAETAERLTVALSKKLVSLGDADPIATEKELVH